MIASGSSPSEMLTKLFVNIFSLFLHSAAVFTFFMNAQHANKTLRHSKGFFGTKLFILLLRETSQFLGLPILCSSRAICKAANCKWTPIPSFTEISEESSKEQFGNNVYETFEFGVSFGSVSQHQQLIPTLTIKTATFSLLVSRFAI